MTGVFTSPTSYRCAQRRGFLIDCTMRFVLLAGLFTAGCARNETPPAETVLLPETKSPPMPTAPRESRKIVSTANKPVSNEPGDSQLDAQWGDLVGRFVFDGPLPTPQPFSIEKDIEFCSEHLPIDESLVIHRENHGIANIVVRLETKIGDKSLPVHESYLESEDARVPLNNRGCRFTPHVCVLRIAQTLVISNTDEVAHNTAAYLNRNDPFNEVTSIGQSTERRIELVERQPVKVACSIHPWMSGWLVVSDHPYAAVTDDNGGFRLQNLPVGERTFQIWQEKSGWVVRGTRNGQPAEWDRGRVTLTIQPGDNDLGEIHIPADVFMSQE